MESSLVVATDAACRERARLAILEFTSCPPGTVAFCGLRYTVSAARMSLERAEGILKRP